MHQIKAEWLLFHIMYVTQLFLLGHMTHFVKVRRFRKYYVAYAFVVCVANVMGTIMLHAMVMLGLTPTSPVK